MPGDFTSRLDALDPPQAVGTQTGQGCPKCLIDYGGSSGRRQRFGGGAFYGEKDLKTTLDDGTEVSIRLHSGMVGELTRAQLRGEDGSW